MTATEPGATVPTLNLVLDDANGTSHDLGATLSAGTVVVGLYKSSCQASKTFFPFLERLHQRYGDTGLLVLGISQDSSNITRSFARRLDVTFPILLEGDAYPVSRAFDITATPTVYVITSDGTVSYRTMGFLRDSVNELGDAVAVAIDQPRSPLFTDDDVAAGVPIFVPG